MDFSKHPLVGDRQSQGNRLLCIFSSDTGLCGGYHHKLFNRIEEFLSGSQGFKISVLAVGREGLRYCKRRGLILKEAVLNTHSRLNEEILDNLSESARKIYLTGEADDVYVAYTHYVSASSFEPRVEKLLPLEIPRQEKTEYLFEPQPKEIFESLILIYFKASLRYYMTHALTAEGLSRVMAMRAASDNAINMLDKLALDKNKLRQGIITRDIIEVISSFTAMKG